MSIVFTQEEIKALQEHPEALRVLADIHEVKLTMAEAIEPGLGDFHMYRKVRLKLEAARLEREWEFFDGLVPECQVFVQGYSDQEVQPHHFRLNAVLQDDGFGNFLETSPETDDVCVDQILMEDVH